MSHVASQTTKAGMPLFTDLACLVQAADMLGLERVDTPHYNWYTRHAGDYPVPAGMKVEEIGHNALFILRVKEPQRSKYARAYGQEPYDIGIIADPNNEGCYTLIYDFWDHGKGVSEVVGEPVLGKHGAVELLCPKLKQNYDMVCDAVAAREAGDAVEFMTMADLRQNYEQLAQQHPELHKLTLPAPQEDEKNTWLSIVTPGERVTAAF